MKLFFILFTFIINFFNPYLIKAEEIIVSSNNQIEKAKKIHIVKEGDTITSISNFYSI